MSFTDPEKNVAELHLREGMHVADFGAGTGHHAIAAGRLAGDHGRVYAVEIQRDLLLNIKTAARNADLANIEIIWGDIETPHGTHIGDGAVDAVILTNTLFQAEDRGVVLAEARRVLKRGGKMLLVEWSDSFGGLGPHQKDVIPEASAKNLLKGAGFTVERSFPAGDHHYGIIAVAA